MTDIDPKWLKKFNQQLSDLKPPPKRIKLKKLWEIFDDVLTHRPDTAHRRQWLLEFLHSAKREKIIEFPKGSWENFGVPRLPNYVELVVEPPAPVNQWWKTEEYWHQSLEWIMELPRVPDKYKQFLRDVNANLKKDRFACAAPFRRRSVELTGDDKSLKDILDSKLFGGRIDRKLLNIPPDVAPLTYEIVGAKPIALVFENREPFSVALPILQNLPHSPYGILAFGEGYGFAKSVGDFLRIQTTRYYQLEINAPLEQIHYVGDLDWAGLKIAQSADRIAQEQGLPSLTPATHLHKAMLDLLLDIASPDGLVPKKTKKSTEKIKKLPTNSEDLIEWLPADVRSEVLRILNLGHRIPEEMLTGDILRNIWS